MQTVNPFFKINRKPSFVYLDGSQVETGKDVLINAENKNIIGEVSKNYKVIENTAVANVFNEAFADIKKKIIVDHLNGSTGKWRREIILDDPEFTFKINRNDTCKTRINVYNSYTGKNSVGFSVNAYRLVCTNGMMGWENELSISIRHMSHNIIDEIRKNFFDKISLFWNKTEIWKAWSEIPFFQEDWSQFIDTRENISDKIKNKYKEMYPAIKRKFNEQDTKYGAYNVLTAIGTHYTKAHKGSNVFSAGYRRIEKLVDEFTNYNPEKKNLLTV